MPIDLAAVNWLYVIVLAVLVFVSTLVGNLLSFHHRMMAALLSAIVFAGLFVFWTYYPHNLPLPTTLTVQKAARWPRSRRRLWRRRKNHATRSRKYRRPRARLDPPESQTCVQVSYWCCYAFA